MFYPVIGLEIHIQSKLNQKMFCACSSQYFGTDPNLNVCPVCMGLPGALPTLNKLAIENCVRLALALNCKINQHTKFDRKNYNYPDLPKSYQISQYDLPVGEHGYLGIKNDSLRIRIKRIHQEEDTAKSIHAESGTLIDFNKSGVALIEVVTEPDFEETSEVLDFAKKLQKIIRHIGASDADMEKGQLRFELNISVATDENKKK